MCVDLYMYVHASSSELDKIRTLKYFLFLFSLLRFILICYYIHESNNIRYSVH